MAQAINVGPIPPMIELSRGIYQGTDGRCCRCMLVEFDDSVFRLVPGNFVIEWFWVEEPFKTINQSSFPLLQLGGRKGKPNEAKASR